MMNLSIAKALLEDDTVDDESWEAANRFVEVTHSEITGQSRWSTYYARVYNDPIDNTYWRITWERGSTEYQESDDLNVSFEQVKPVEKVVIDYVKV